MHKFLFKKKKENHDLPLTSHRFVFSSALAKLDLFIPIQLNQGLDWRERNFRRYLGVCWRFVD